MRPVVVVSVTSGQHSCYVDLKRMEIKFAGPFRLLCAVPMNVAISQRQEEDHRLPIRWPHGLKCASEATWFLWSRVRIPPGTWMSLSCECRVLSGRGFCVGPITRPEESYRVWSWRTLGRPWRTKGCCALKKGLHVSAEMDSRDFHIPVIRSDDG